MNKIQVPTYEYAEGAIVIVRNIPQDAKFGYLNNRPAIVVAPFGDRGEVVILPMTSRMNYPGVKLRLCNGKYEYSIVQTMCPITVSRANISAAIAYLNRKTFEFIQQDMCAYLGIGEHPQNTIDPTSGAALVRITMNRPEINYIFKDTFSAQQPVATVVETGSDTHADSPKTTMDRIEENLSPKVEKPSGAKLVHVSNTSKESETIAYVDTPVKSPRDQVMEELLKSLPSKEKSLQALQQWMDKNELDGSSEILYGLKTLHKDDQEIIIGFLVNSISDVSKAISVKGGNLARIRTTLSEIICDNPSRYTHSAQYIAQTYITKDIAPEILRLYGRFCKTRKVK